MLQALPATDRGHTDAGWLDSHHTFSFGDFMDPRRMGFRALRVLNDDRVEAGQGFGSHPHRDMEILSWVLEGALAHRDSMGTGSTIRPGDIQRMSAGTGVVHSEFNASKTDGVHFLQIWLIPESRGIPPGYEQKTLAPEALQNRFAIIAAREPPEGAVKVHQDAVLRAGRFTAGQGGRVELGTGRHAFVHVARGAVTVNGQKAGEGDGLAISGEPAVDVAATSDAEVLIFELG